MVKAGGIGVCTEPLTFFRNESGGQADGSGTLILGLPTEAGTLGHGLLSSFALMAWLRSGGSGSCFSRPPRVGVCPALEVHLW